MPVAPPQERLTRSVEDYLKVIYRLSRSGRPATTSEIAEALALSPPSVSGMVKRLSEQGLLNHEPYRGAELTPEGRRAALRMLRRHRLIETYLVAFLAYSWDTVHEEAERLEHAVSDVLIERMAEALGNPKVDPHGDPIPAADGSITELIYVPLTEIPVGASAELCRVDTGHPDRLRYLASLGLTPGVVFTAVDHQPFQGPVTVRVGGTEHVLGHQMACLLLCQLRDRTG